MRSKKKKLYSPCIHIDTYPISDNESTTDSIVKSQQNYDEQGELNRK
jgi:hypothetical protein